MMASGKRMCCQTFVVCWRESVNFFGFGHILLPFLPLRFFLELLLRLFFRDYENFGECENCLTFPKPHQEEKSLFPKEFKTFHL